MPILPTNPDTVLILIVMVGRNCLNMKASRDGIKTIFARNNIISRMDISSSMLNRFFVKNGSVKGNSAELITT